LAAIEKNVVSSKLTCHTLLCCGLKEDMSQSILPLVVIAGTLLLTCSAAPVVLPTATIMPLTLGENEARVVTVVRIPKPWWAPRFVVESRFVDAIGQYALIDGLEYKAFTLSDLGQFGGIYLWQTPKAASAWFDNAWHERVQRKYNVSADLQVFDALWTVDGPDRATGEVLPQRALKSHAVAVLVLSEHSIERGRQEELLRAFAVDHGLAPGLVRLNFIRDTQGHIGVAELWSSREAAETYWTPTRRMQAAGKLQSSLSQAWFSAPVLLDAEQAKQDARTAHLVSGPGDKR
jgi:hypothetical protein